MITCRLLAKSEFERYAQFLKERGMDSKAIYFGYSISNDGIDTLVDDMIDNAKYHNIVVAEDDDLEIVGTIHIASVSDHEVEFGVMVAEAYRQHGVASQMMEFAMTWARNRNLRDIWMHCLSYNAPILHLVKKHGLEVSQDHGDADARVTLPPTTIFSIQREMLLKQQNAYTRSLKEHALCFRRMLNVQ